MAIRAVVDFLHLHPSSRLERSTPASENARFYRTTPDSLQCLEHQFGPILNSHNHVSRVYIIKVMSWVEPWTVDVVDHKSDVRRNPAGYA